MIEHVDFYYNNDRKIIMTEQYHIERGYCCGSKCKHCPYWPKYQTGNRNIKLQENMTFVNIHLPELSILKERLNDPVRKDDWLRYYNKCDSLLGSEESLDYLQSQLNEFNKDRKVESIL